jgi:hypothetical protein
MPLDELLSEFELDGATELSPELMADSESEAGEKIKRFLRNRVLGFMMKTLVSANPTMPIVPVQQPTVEVNDPRQNRRGSGTREAEFEAVRAHPSEAQLMERLGRLAAESDNEAEAEALIGALLPLAGKVVPGAEPALTRAAPQLLHALAGATRALRSNQATRPLVDRMPAIARRTALDVDRMRRLGRPVDKDAVARALVAQAMRALHEEGPERVIGDVAPAPNDGVSANIFHWKNIDAIGRYLRRQQWQDIRTAMSQVAGGRGDPILMASGRGGSTRGMALPDQQAIDPSGRRVHIEVDTDPRESAAHQRKIFRLDKNPGLGPLAGKARGVFIVQDPRTGRVTSVRHVDPSAGRPVTRQYGPQGVPLATLIARGVLTAPVKI